MYEITNLIIHVLILALAGFALFTHEESRYDEMTLQRIAVFAAFIIWGGWAFLVGVAHNFKSLFWLF